MSLYPSKWCACREISESKLLLSEETSRDGCAVNDASGDALRNTSAQNLEAKGQIVQVGVKIPTGDASGIAFS
ncbi:unnamed protein product [Rhizophagus irregularis]|nr:unnamed protein product [Rhizophagus irregularis]